MKAHTSFPKLARLFMLLALALCASAGAMPVLAQQQGRCAPPVVQASSAETNMFSEEQETFLGEAVAERIQKDYRIIEDAELTNYLARLGEHLPFARTGSLLVETGKGSFRLRSLISAGDWLVIADTLNRVQVYSLKTGEQKGRVFGNNATVSVQRGLLCVENERGKLAIYDLGTMEKRDELVFSNPVSLASFSDDGARLFVLTSNQTAYVIDVSALASQSAASK